MKILLAVHHFPPDHGGGAEYRALRTARELIARGHKVQVVCVEAIDDKSTQSLRYEDEIFKDISVRRLFLNMENAPDKAIWEFDNRWIGDHFVQSMRDDRPDVLHVISGYLMTVSPLQAARLLGIPSIISLTDYWFLCPRITLLRSNGELSTLPIDPVRCVRCLHEEKRRFRWPGNLFPRISDFLWSLHTKPIGAMERRNQFLLAALNDSDALISPSQFLRSMYIQAGVDADRIIYSRQGQPEINVSTRNSRKISNGPLRLAYIGKVSAHKGVHVIFEALRILEDAAFTFSIYGDVSFPDTYQKELMKIASNDARIEFCGTFERNELDAIHDSIDVLVVPSVWYENSPNVVLEAFNLGTPVIASDLGGLSELIEEGQNGYLFTKGDAGDLAAKIKLFLDAPDHVKALIEGMTKPRTVAEEIDELEQIYRSVLRLKGRRGE